MDNLSLNRVELRGRIGQDPRIAKVGDSTVARFSVATSEIYKDRNGDLKEETTWHNVSAWNGRNIADFSGLRKGVPVSVVGRIRNVRYTSTEGEERQYSEIQASRLAIVDAAEAAPAAVS
ncbi:MAG: single-stranded DNA-binding protein [Bacteroidales bacterium]|nr:single-stranded DNA-binding protein [Bacteroidales bacterium]